MADEVYQSNIYNPEIPFISFRKVLAEIGNPYRDNVELISLHSISKGLMGECGFRGGYFESHNLDPFAEEILYKLKSIGLCSNTVGQIAMDLMVNPPTKGRESDECYDQYSKERDTISNGLAERAKLLTQTFNEMHNITCNDIEGAMYGFPQVKFSKNALLRAKDMNVQPDFMYCLDMLNETGIMVVPGSGFGQEPGTHHFRITNLVTPTSDMKETLDALKVFNDKFHLRYE